MKNLTERLKTIVDGMGKLPAEKMTDLVTALTNELCVEMLSGDNKVVPDDVMTYLSSMSQEQKIFLVNAFCHGMSRTSALAERMGQSLAIAAPKEEKPKETKPTTIPLFTI